VFGIALMAAPILCICAMTLLALNKKRTHVEFDLVALVVYALMWMAGRILAGDSLWNIAFS
jgi:hypothetical protein